ncbi:12758_t:CDS:1 [Dentiscutata heterogama]|uniref:12758_t:CDS:1 n=1 Tax=Dentiscutata heterogama TaxID=1316150 RepID=A0ACA9MUJ2_9GLOM|nr:12758_t:CDS:1 [Dentiscutata heterogama]
MSLAISNFANLSNLTSLVISNNTKSDTISRYSSMYKEKNKKIVELLIQELSDFTSENEYILVNKLHMNIPKDTYNLLYFQFIKSEIDEKNIKNSNHQAIFSNFKFGEKLFKKLETLKKHCNDYNA